MTKRYKPVEIPEDWPVVPGNTYPVKEQLKAIGAKWDANLAGGTWRVDPSKLLEATEIACGQTPQAPESFAVPRGALSSPAATADFRAAFPDAQALPGKPLRVVGENAEARVRAWFAQRGAPLT